MHMDAHDRFAGMANGFKTPVAQPHRALVFVLWPEIAVTLDAGKAMGPADLPARMTRGLRFNVSHRTPSRISRQVPGLE